MSENAWFYSSWDNGEAVASYSKGVEYEAISYAKLSRETGRSDMSLKKWHVLYMKYSDRNGE